MIYTLTMPRSFFMSRKGDGAEKEGMKAEEFRDVVEGEVVED